nr:hypothetical protein [Gemmatimonadaceae bacterium]
DRYVSDATNGRYKNLAALNKAVATPAVRGAARSVARGVTFNFDDELARALNVGQAPGGMYSPEGEAQFQQFRRDNPMTAAAGEILGGLAIPGAGLVRGTTLAGTIGRSAAVGAAQGGLSQAGDAQGGVGDRAMAGVIGAGVGGALGGAIPAVTAGAQIANRVRRAGVPEFAARMTRAQAVANAGDIGSAAGTLTPQPRAGFRQLPERVAAGTRRLADIARTFDVNDRGQQVVIGDLTDELRAQTVNAVRGNPALAASADAQRLIDRAQGAPARLAGDITVAQQARGVTPTRPLLREEQQAALGALQRAVPDQFGAVPRVPGPDDIGQMTPSASGLNADARIREQQDNLQAWAAGPTGYGGLRAATPNGVPNLFNELDGPQTRLNQLIARQPSMETSRALSQVSETLALLRSGAGQAPNGNILVDEARDAVGRITELLDQGFTPVGGGKRIRLSSAETNILKDARDQIVTAMDRRMAATSASPFSAVNREYAERSARIRAVERGQTLANSIAETTTQGVPMSPTAFRQEFEAIDPRFRDEARLAIAGRVLNDLSGSIDAATGRGVVRKLVDAADQAYTAKVALAFPSKPAFRRFLFQAEALRAVERGAEWFQGKTADELRAFMGELATSARGASGAVDKAKRREVLESFRTGMLSRFLNDANSPDDVARIAELVTTNDPETIRKLELVFKKSGVRQLRQRLSTEDAMAQTSEFMRIATRNPAERDRGLPARLLGRNNPVTAEGNVLGVTRRLLEGTMGRRYQAEMLRLGAMGASPQTFPQFADLMQQTTQGVNTNTVLNRVGPTALVRGAQFGFSGPPSPQE